MKIINKLTIKHLTKNRKRTIVTIVAITLVATLLFSLGFAFGTYQKSEEERLKQNNLDYAAAFTQVPYAKRKVLDNDKNVRKYEYISKLYSSDKVIRHTINGDVYLDIYTYLNDFFEPLTGGRLPKDNTELAVSLDTGFSLGDTVKLNVTFDGKTAQKEYKIVGVYAYSVPSAITKESNISSSSDTTFYVYLKDKTNIYNQLFQIARDFDLKETYIIGEGETFENMEVNTRLLELYGNFLSSTKKALIFLSLFILSAVLSVACSIIIYNSFAISLSERKKQIGILKSVGMTKKQVRKLIFREAIFVSLISIPLGFILSYLFVSLVVLYINNVQSGLRVYTISLYPEYALICLIFILLTVMYASFIPASRASMLTPIETIRQNDDYKMKRVKKRKSSIYRFIASCNMKRNKSKYRVALIGITICFCLFVTLGTFLNFFEKNIDENSLQMYARITTNVSFEDAEKELKDVSKLPSVKETLLYNHTYVTIPNKGSNVSSLLLELDDDTYKQIKDKYHINNDNPIYYVNRFSYDISNGTSICYDEQNCTSIPNFNKIEEIPKILERFYVTNHTDIVIIVNKDTFNQITDDKNNVLVILSSDYLKLDKEVKTYISENENLVSFDNFGLEFASTYNDFKCIKVVIYTLIVLFAVISITSIINTISASINLRKREFAIFKSIGLDPKNFNKIFLIEAMILSIKTIIYGTILSIIIVYLIMRIFILGSIECTFMDVFPMNYYLVACITVFIIIILTIFISIKKLRHENIMETIKNENV